MELVLAVVGPVAGAVFGMGTFLVRRSMTATDARLTDIAENIEVISHQVTSLQVSLPTTYVTKEELLLHIRGEERQHAETMERLRELREELSSIRSEMYHRGN